MVAAENHHKMPTVNDTAIAAESIAHALAPP